MISVVESWGSTEPERAAAFPCDGLIERPGLTLFRAIDVEAPAAVVFRWLCQLKVAPYSYDWIDNLGRRSPRRLTPGVEQLAVGQRFMTIFRLVGFEPDRSITLSTEGGIFGHVVCTYRVIAADGDSSRLVVKLMTAERPGIVAWVVEKILPAGDLVMMRRQLLNLKRLAESGQA